MSNNYLFSGPNWFSVMEQQREQLSREVEGLDGDRILNTPVEDLVTYFERKYSIEVPVLSFDDIRVEQTEAVNHVQDYGRSVRVTGTEIHAEIPMQGDPDVLSIMPSVHSSMPPMATADKNCVRFKVSGANMNPDSLRNEIHRMISSLEWYLGSNNMTSLRRRAEPGCSARRP